MMDLTKFLATVAAHPETRKVMASLREKGVADFLMTAGLFPAARMMVLPGIGIFAAGAVVGAATAMLVTPRTGEAFRADIAELIKGLRTQAEEKVQEASSNGGAKSGTSRRASASS